MPKKSPWHSINSLSITTTQIATPETTSNEKTVEAALETKDIVRSVQT